MSLTAGRLQKYCTLIVTQRTTIIHPTMNESFILILVVGMLFTGTINTILNKLQDLQCVNNCQDPDPANRKYYEQPVWQVRNVLISLMLDAQYVLG